MTNPRDAFWPLGITFAVINALAVGLRFWARGLKQAVGYDDLALAVSFVGFVVFVAMELVAVDNGIGIDTTTIDPLTTKYDLIKAAKFFTIASIVYILATGISKLGVALVLHRLAANADMRVVRVTLVVSMAIVAVWSLAIALVFALQCRPLSVAWGEGTGTCIATSVIGNAAIALSSMDVAVSWLYALLPIYMLWKAQLKLKIKLTIIVLLGMGAVSSVATIIRLKYVVQVADMTNSAGGIAGPDVVQTTLEATIYSMIEIGLSIFAASMTALRPLIKRIPCFSDFSSGGRSGAKGVSTRSGTGTDRIPGPSYRLDDMHTSDADSQEEIIAPRTIDTHKESRVEVSYTPKTAGKKGRKQEF